MDSQPVKTHSQQQNLMLRHISAIRNREMFRSSRIIVMVENNLGKR